MKGIVVHGEPGNPILVWEDVADVTYGSDDVLVRVGATAVNRADLLQARGNYPPPLGASKILGLEMAGTIEAIGANVFDWQVGDRVCALLPGGGYAEKVAVPQQMLLSLPDVWQFTQGAAIPEVWLTAFVNLFGEGQLQSGERVLIHAGGSGVGTAAVQLAHAVGAIPFVTAGTEAKLARCRELGASVAINYKVHNFLEAVMEVTDGEGVDLILDPVGGSYLAQNIRALRRFGRLINIGLLGGLKGELNMGHVLRKRLHLVGSTLRTRPVSEKIAITHQFADRFWAKFLSRELKPIIDTIFPITEAQAAHQYVLENRNIGKVVLSME